MWAEACELLERADRMHRQFFRLTSSSGQSHAVWEPPVDVFEDAQEVVIMVALPGVRADCIEISTEAGMLVLRAERRIPFAGSTVSVRQLEIPYGYFERQIRLSQVALETITREFRDGCLILRLSKTGNL